MAYRGSRKHVLDWVERERFLPELLALARPVDCRISSSSCWQPVSYRAPDEARLESFGPTCLPYAAEWSCLTDWWLAHPEKANTPNWDIALSCEIEGRPGLILVEAKANCPELSPKGKVTDGAPSERSARNHDHIGHAISEARTALAVHFPEIAISRDTHYQLSNRIAFAWQLARMGVPTVIVYLGFSGDDGIADVGEPFRDDEHWQDAFRRYRSSVSPDEMWEAPIEVGSSRFWLLSRSRSVLEQSPPAS